MVTLQEMDTSELERNAKLGLQHADRLAAHGYRQVWHDKSPDQLL